MNARPKTTTPEPNLARRREVRVTAARIRRAESPDAPPELVRSAETYLANRARYDARRAEVRALAASVRAGRKPRIPARMREAVAKYLAYRVWYNSDRVNKRRAPAATTVQRSLKRRQDGRGSQD
jgi:hypothetical protein